MYQINIKRLPGNEDLPLPQKMSLGASGFDLNAAVIEDVVLRSGERILIPTGYSIEVPIGMEAQVRPRSGLALRHGITVLNTPGTIDADYRGEIKIIMINLGQEDFIIKRFDRVAQLVFMSIPKVSLLEADILSETKRGIDGFGHTGK